MLSPSGQSYIITIMQQTIYLIFILILVLEAIGLGFATTHLETSMYIKLLIFFIEFIFKFPLLPLSSLLILFLAPLSHNWDPNRGGGGGARGGEWLQKVQREEHWVRTQPAWLIAVREWLLEFYSV